MSVSEATVKVCVQWSEAPEDEDILIALKGQVETINTYNNPSGSACITFVVPADGTTNNTVWAEFKYTTACGDETKFNLPEACPPLLNCNCDIPAGQNKIKVTFSADCKSVCICSGKDISNIVFDFGNGCFQNFNIDIKKEGDDLIGNLKKQIFSFSQPINGVWVKAGNNNCDDAASDKQCSDGPGEECCPGCGEYFECNNENIGSLQAATTSTEQSAPLLFKDAPVQREAFGDIRVFPNPTNGDLYVELGSFAGKAARIQVFNTIGQLMYQTEVDEITAEAMRLDLHALTSEMYFLKVHIPNEGSFTQKFIVRK